MGRSLPFAMLYSFLLDTLILRATGGACNANLQVVFSHVLHVFSQHLFGLNPLSVNGMHKILFDHMHFNLSHSLTFGCYYSRSILIY